MGLQPKQPHYAVVDPDGEIKRQSNFEKLS